MIYIAILAVIALIMIPILLRLLNHKGCESALMMKAFGLYLSSNGGMSH